ncbi:TetR/AcrR family transcriptional regulator [Deinococcus sp. Leaf326]|uniref:TetR/AcrR family transcriptional regulator n=1 Tax=Deinococcus sp. Leaf326 TaxID=1736338 RepID=UPI0009EC1EF1|nr:TetR/AcrR family transcriptional regulator [Deinococcus sp. Leaf326]
MNNPKKAEQQLAFPTRKQPQQARSRQMVDRLLHAAAQVFMTEGIEGATTNRIAEVAGVSVGSLYQFFPNKLTMLAELQRLWTERLGAELDVTFGRPHRPLVDLVDEVLGVHAFLQRESGGLLGFLLTNHHVKVNSSVRQTVQERLEHMASLRRLGSDPVQNVMIARMTIHIADALYSLSPEGANNPQVRAEVRQALLAYLGTTLNEPLPRGL